MENQGERTDRAAGARPSGGRDGEWSSDSKEALMGSDLCASRGPTGDAAS